MKRPKSKKARKQRKFLHQAPLHVRRKLMAAHLSKELAKKYKTKSLPLRKGDEVEIMRGEFRGKKGKIAKINLKKYRIYVEGITRKRSVGTQALVGIHPSKVRVINLNLEDKRRVKILERKSKKS